MKATIVLLCLVFGLAAVFAHDACTALPGTAFADGSQHADCDYVDVPPQNVTDAEHANDLYWINMVHQYAVTNMPTYPFGAALVDSRNNSLVTIGFNSFFTGDPVYSSIAVSHAETVVMTYASINIMPGTWNETTKKRTVDPNWKYLTLYGNIETCPMCAQAAIWRGLRRMVFGARASVLQAQRCWTQPTLTAYEMVDHSASFAPFQFVRGPMPELELSIVNDFKQQCKTTPAPTPAPSPCVASVSLNKRGDAWVNNGYTQQIYDINVTNIGSQAITAVSVNLFGSNVVNSWNMPAQGNSNYQVQMWSGLAVGSSITSSGFQNSGSTPISPSIASIACN